LSSWHALGVNRLCWLDRGLGWLQDGVAAGGWPGRGGVRAAGVVRGGALSEVLAGSAAFGGERRDPVRNLVLPGAGLEVELVAVSAGGAGFGGAEGFDGLAGVAAA